MVAAVETKVDFTLSELEELTHRLGSTFFVLDLDRLRGDYERFHAAFRKRLGDRVLIAYSVKTNYTPRVLQTVRSLGSAAEVVSQMEYEMARRAGFEAGQIVVDGPFYEEAFLEQLLLGESRVNLDGWYMLSVLDRVSRAHPERRFRVGLRLHLSLPGVEWSRFGFADDDDGWRRLGEWFAAHDNCELVGLHSHFALAAPSTESYALRLQKMIDASRRLPNVRLEYLDLGGGMRQPPEGPEYEELADGLAKVLEAAYGVAERPILILEPGTAVVGASVALVTRVQDVKQVAGRVLALIGASNLCINTMMWKQRLAVAHMRVGGEARWAEGEVFSLVGNTSAERKDVVCEGLAGPVGRGDLVIVDRVGAYSANFKPPFIHMCPPIVARSQGEYEVIKRPETVDDVLATYL